MTIFRNRIVTILGIVILAISALAVFPVAAQTAVVVDYTDIYNQVSPSVVSISVRTGGTANGLQQGGSGTGFVMDTQGNIITNNHVVDGAIEIVVEFLDGTLARADIVGLDPDSDLAVIRVQDVPAERLVPVRFGDSAALEVGDPVLAIGSPFGEDWTLTSGIVSGLDRTINGLDNFSIGGVIQTDAAINPGNSGGPLLNLSGEVVGVNSQIISRSGSNSGIGFAVPGNLTERVAQELIANGSVEYSYIGINGGNVSIGVIEALNLPNNTQGVVVSQAVVGGPAARAGVQSLRGNQSTITGIDIITAIDGTPITGIESLISYLARDTRPGDTVTMTVLRNGSQTVQLPVTLTERP